MAAMFFDVDIILDALVKHMCGNFKASFTMLDNLNVRRTMKLCKTCYVSTTNNNHTYWFENVCNVS